MCISFSYPNNFFQIEQRLTLVVQKQHVQASDTAPTDTYRSDRALSVEGIGDKHKHEYQNQVAE